MKKCGVSRFGPSGLPRETKQRNNHAWRRASGNAPADDIRRMTRSTQSFPPSIASSNLQPTPLHYSSMIVQSSTLACISIEIIGEHTAD